MIGLFGPTDSKEIYFYGDGKIIRSNVKCKNMPCYKLECVSGKKCMEKINTDVIIDRVNDFGKVKR